MLVSDENGNLRPPTEEELALFSVDESDPLADLEYWRENVAVCTRRQGMLVVGAQRWSQVEQILADYQADPNTSEELIWSLRVAIYETQEWRRNDPDMQLMIWFMNMTPEEADEMFRQAMMVV